MGRVKRVAKDGSWANVEWDDGCRRYVKRYETKHMFLLNPVLNKFIKSAKGVKG